MFSRILIANRGEIACRVIESAHELGVSSIAVYSDADAGSRHVALADTAVNIGGSAPGESYLCGARIIAAALETGAQAIHPGYGFLSENPEFVDDVEAAGLVFIGPSARSIRAMGLKDAAKELMALAGVPVVPGYHGKNQDADFLLQEANAIGFPVMIKAVAGGGGKGMRVVTVAADFADALLSAQSESRSAFGNDAVLIEKFISHPRHIEVQIFGDGQDVVHLFERDCSLQRRHQKVIEEAPAPGMTDVMRAALCDAAVRAARAINYRGAGTVEFIVDGSVGLQPDRFWFMEMNTRLQVEHPVSEAITGVDLVAWQLRVAAGEALPKRQDELSITGHAFEARVYAEDVPGGFLPATGMVKHLRFPPNVRVDTGIREEDAISPFYDPMIAKLTVWGPSREIALLQLKAAISGSQIAGTITNLTFLGKLAVNDDFRTGNVSTGLIEQNLVALSAQDFPPDAVIGWACVVATVRLADMTTLSGFALWQPMRRACALVWQGAELHTDIAVRSSEQIDVTIDGRCISFHNRGAHWVETTTGQKFQHFATAENITIFGDEIWEFSRPDPLAVATGVENNAGSVAAPMPGVVKAVLEQPGADVKQGARLLVLEAMKMEHVLCAPRDGKIAQLHVHPSDQVEAGAILITLEDIAQ